MATQVKSLNTTKLDSKIDIEGLTDVDLKGKGVLDNFLQLQRLVLDREFNDGRIQGKEYADSFIATYTINMELAIKFLLEKEKQFYEIEVLEAQKQQLDLQNELLASQISEQEYKNTHHLPLETEGLSLRNSNLENDIELKAAQITEQEYKNINHLPLETIGLSLRNDNLEKDLEVKDSQISNALKDLELKEYELTNIKPQELALKEYELTKIMPKELALKEYELTNILPQEFAIKEYELTNILPQELVLKATQIDATLKDTELKDYELNFIKPQELSIKASQLDVIVKDLELKDYELRYIIPQELALKASQENTMLKDIELKDYELKYIKPQELDIKTSQLANAEKELLLKAKQLELAEYELLNKSPAEVAGILANNELIGQKKTTEKAQTDASAYGPNSVIDWNVKTLESQIAGIEQDSKQKIMRMLLSTWETRLNNDGVDNPSDAGLADIDIKQTVDAAKASVGII